MIDAIFSVSALAYGPVAPAAGGVSVPDISSWLSDSFRYQSLAIFVGRSDLNCSNTITPVDLSTLLTVSLPGTSSHSCGAAVPVYCH